MNRVGSGSPSCNCWVWMVWLAWPEVWLVSCRFKPSASGKTNRLAEWSRPRYRALNTGSVARRLPGFPESSACPNPACWASVRRGWAAGLRPGPVGPGWVSVSPADCRLSRRIGPKPVVPPCTGREDLAHRGPGDDDLDHARRERVFVVDAALAISCDGDRGGDVWIGGVAARIPLRVDALRRKRLAGDRRDRRDKAESVVLPAEDCCWAATASGQKPDRGRGPCRRGWIRRGL